MADAATEKAVLLPAAEQRVRTLHDVPGDTLQQMLLALQQLPATYLAFVATEPSEDTVLNFLEMRTAMRTAQIRAAVARQFMPAANLEQLAI